MLQNALVWEGWSGLPWRWNMPCPVFSCLARVMKAIQQDPQLSYSSLKDRYNITKSTFYRWKRQTQEHRKKAATRYEAKHFLQMCFAEGKLLPLNQFKEFFPEISRSTYYAWKHELLQAGSGDAFMITKKQEVGGDGDVLEQEGWSPPERHLQNYYGSVPVANVPISPNNERLVGDRAQNFAFMQEAKKCLQNCIATNALLPYRNFKKSFPGISRSTYYNWRREAIMANPGFKDAFGSSEDSLDAERSPLAEAQCPVKMEALVRFAKVTRGERHKKSFYSSFERRKKLREEAKRWVQKWGLAFSHFKVKYPTISSSSFWFWKKTVAVKKAEKAFNWDADWSKSSVSTRPLLSKQTMLESELVPSFEKSNEHLDKRPFSPYNATISAYTGSDKSMDDQVFVMDVVALANFKAKAKLFLQQRFEEKSFPTFKEFRSYFPLTPRSTYYMWKRALHHGLTLKDRYNITKSTFYRWKRQTQEHRKKAATRYEAKHFLQMCFAEGKLLPLNQFKEFFPEISRSTYYAWKHELLQAGSGDAFMITKKQEVGGDGDVLEQEGWSPPERHLQNYYGSVPVANVPISPNNERLVGDRAQNFAFMQEAKKCLQNCIATNALLPYRNFKKSFPGISRSTYYNWRREAIMANPGFKDAFGSSEDSLDAERSPLAEAQCPVKMEALVRFVKVTRGERHKKSFFSSFERRKKLRIEAKRWVQKWGLAFSHFKVKYPTISSSSFWFWKKTVAVKKAEKAFNWDADWSKSSVSTRPLLSKQTTLESELVPSFEKSNEHLDKRPFSPYNATISAYTGSDKSMDDQVFVMDVVALANFKAKAKLFLQQRFEEKSFPTFKEFRSYFPLTPRSTYYMWKRALHHGLTLVHG
ncbi:UNVERIFIED_CONTAM: hypothetical protein FKN15_016912 [Acipenser sinensis]